jgi:hypothetical protein
MHPLSTVCRFLNPKVPERLGPQPIVDKLLDYVPAKVKLPVRHLQEAPIPIRV